MDYFDGHMSFDINLFPVGFSNSAYYRSLPIELQRAIDDNREHIHTLSDMVAFVENYRRKS